MKTLFINGKIVDVFSESLIDANVLVEDGVIIGVGDYNEADEIIDVEGKILSPGFVDGHIHIESTMLSVTEFAKIALQHGTVSAVTDPHEITNVCGTEGIDYMIQASEGLPLNVYVMLPSCVPATAFDESHEEIGADKLEPYFEKNRVLGLAEMMNYPGVLFNDEGVMAKIKLAKQKGKLIDGHAPLLMGKDLDTYIRAGINSDHECSNVCEAIQKIQRGQWIMIRQGTAAKNLNSLLPLFDGPMSNRCLLVTDDKEPWDLLEHGHIDNIIRLAGEAGKSVIRAIRMATINAATCFRLNNHGAIAPGYKADILVLNDLNSVDVNDVYINGKLAVKDKNCLEFNTGSIDKDLENRVMHTMNVKPFADNAFKVTPKGENVRVIEVLPGQLLTNEKHYKLDFNTNNGIDLDRDILKIAVIERHKSTGHIGIGYIQGIGLKKGAIASTVSHDSHNIIVIGTNDSDMILAARRIIEIGGGNVIAKDGSILGELSLPIAGLMSNKPIKEFSQECKELRSKVYDLGVKKEIAPFMNMAFVSLPVIPFLKITTKGLVDVGQFKFVDLFVEE